MNIGLTIHQILNCIEPDTTCGKNEERLWPRLESILHRNLSREDTVAAPNEDEPELLMLRGFIGAIVSMLDSKQAILSGSEIHRSLLKFVAEASQRDARK